jgi:hypothetical protein
MVPLELQFLAASQGSLLDVTYFHILLSTMDVTRSYQKKITFPIPLSHVRTHSVTCP